MQVTLRELLSVFTGLVLTVVPSFGLSGPSNVTITCDSYGVVVDWEATGVSQNTDFRLIIKPDFGEQINITTSTHPYNISDHLLDTGFNRYVLTVIAADGKAAESPIFSFSSEREPAILCDLKFPPVHLTAADNALVVSFSNPLRLYRDTPALRKLRETDELLYVITKKQDHEFTCALGSETCEGKFTCALESETCEGTVSFQEEQEEYCVILFGEIRQTLVQSTEQCHRGSLKPSVPIILYLIPLIVFVVMLVLSLVIMLCAKKINNEIKKKNSKKMPPWLCWMPGPFPAIVPTKPEYEPVEKNPRVELITIIPLLITSPEGTTLLENSANSLLSSRFPPNPTGEDNFGKEPESGEPEKTVEEVDPHDNGDVLLSDYDCPHSPHFQVEMSPGDNVGAYGPRCGLFESPPDD